MNLEDPSNASAAPVQQSQAVNDAPAARLPPLESFLYSIGFFNYKYNAMYGIRLPRV